MIATECPKCHGKKNRGAKQCRSCYAKTHIPYTRTEKHRKQLSDRHKGIDKRILSNGYIIIRLDYIHPRAYKIGNLKDHCWVYEHIKVACDCHPGFDKNAVVHHINGDKTNNIPSNLLICDKSYHRWLHNQMSYLYQQENFGA